MTLDSMPTIWNRRSAPSGWSSSSCVVIISRHHVSLIITLQFHPQRAVIPQTTGRKFRRIETQTRGVCTTPQSHPSRNYPCHEAASVSAAKKVNKNKKAALGLNRSSTAGRLPILFASAPERALSRSMPLVGLAFRPPSSNLPERSLPWTWLCLSYRNPRPKA